MLSVKLIIAIVAFVFLLSMIWLLPAFDTEEEESALGSFLRNMLILLISLSIIYLIWFLSFVMTIGLTSIA